MSTTPMRHFLYRTFLRCPRFRGKARLESLLRRCFSPSRQRVIHDLWMQLDPIEWPQAEILARGCLEPLTTALFSKLLRPGDVYLDVGAHVGFHTLVARHYVGQSGRVIAVEPQPHNCSKLLANWQANQFANVFLYVAAAGERDGSIVLHDQKATDRSRLTLSLDAVNDEPQRFQVPMLRIDTICESQSVERIRLLKIDVEGYELQVLRGCTSFASRIDHVVLELLDAEDEAASVGGILEELRNRGFSTWRTVNGDPWAPGSPLPENNVWASRPPL
jgi:FkbM family methyltransferase